MKDEAAGFALQEPVIFQRFMRCILRCILYMSDNVP